MPERGKYLHRRQLGSKQRQSNAEFAKDAGTMMSYTRETDSVSDRWPLRLGITFPPDH